MDRCTSLGRVAVVPFTFHFWMMNETLLPRCSQVKVFLYNSTLIIQIFIHDFSDVFLGLHYFCLLLFSKCTTFLLLYKKDRKPFSIFLSHYNTVLCGKILIRCNKGLQNIMKTRLHDFIVEYNDDDVANDLQFPHRCLFCHYNLPPVSWLVKSSSVKERPS